MDCNFKKVELDKETYIKYWNKDNFEIHIRAYGPLGANVYKYTNGTLDWKQRRSYSFVSKLKKPQWRE